MKRAVIVTATAFALAAVAAAGMFGHVAIWTGSRAELVDAGVWDELIVNQYAEPIDQVACSSSSLASSQSHSRDSMLDFASAWSRTS